MTTSIGFMAWRSAAKKFVGSKLPDTADARFPFTCLPAVAFCAESTLRKIDLLGDNSAGDSSTGVT